MKREEMAMEKVFEAINGVFSFIGPLSDFLWEFPTNFDWYSSIPILGNISFAIILLLGSGIFFSFRIGFMQVTYFKKGIRTMTEKRVVETGISPLASFFLSSAAEHLVHTTKKNQARFDFDLRFPKMPSYLRRAAIQHALGSVSSYKTRLELWKKMDKKGGTPKLVCGNHAMPVFYRDVMYSESTRKP